MNFSSSKFCFHFFLCHLFFLIFLVLPHTSMALTFTAADITGDNGDGHQAAYGDVNNDGHIDIYVAHSYYDNRLWLNDGNGSFTLSNIPDETANLYTYGALMLDVDNDGDLDIYATNYNGAQNKLWINDGLGNGGASFTASDITGDTGNSEKPASADFDNDGDLDILVANNGVNKLWINDGLGNGGASFSSSAFSPYTGYSYSAETGDFNNDGYPDIYIVNENQNRLWMNNGDGTFTESNISGDSGNSMDAEIADFDNDGDLDIYVVNWDYSPKQNKLWINDGLGNGGASFTASDIAGDTECPKGLAVSDIDNDGDLDIYLANYEQNNFWINDGLGNGGSSFTRMEISGDNRLSQNAIICDFNHDSKPDIYVMNANNLPTNLWINNLPDSLQTYTASDITNDLGNSRGIISGDIDNDGDLDIYISNWSEQNKLYINDSAGNGGSSFTSSDITDDLGSSYGAVFGDIDSDGDLDLYSTNYGEQNKLYINDGLGNGGLSFIASDITGDLGNSRTAVMADIDNDGDLDIYVANRMEQNKLYINDGLGNGGSSFTASDITGDNTGDTFQVLAVDVDNDGDIDLYAVNEGGEQNKLWINDGLGNGGSSFTASDITGDAFDSESAVFGDIDNDGDLDLYESNYSGQNKLWINDGLGNGGSSFSASDISGDLDASRGTAMGDVDNDGDLDIYVVNLDTQNKLWINDGLGNGGSSFSASDISGDTWESTRALIADLDKDGDLDIYVLNVNQQNKLWINNLKYKPNFTSMTASVDTTDEDTEVEITLDEIKTQADESDQDGTVDAFIVKSVSSGALKIGADNGSAMAWAASSNDVIDATHNAYWMPAANENGSLNAFTVTAKDNDGFESTNGSIQVQVTVNAVNDPPTLTAIPDPAPIPEDSGEQTVDLNGVGSGVTSGPGAEPDILTITAVSDNPGLLPDPTIVYIGPEEVDHLSYTPVSNEYGTANITVTITDRGLDGVAGNGDDLSVNDVFTVTVTPVNDVPVINGISTSDDPSHFTSDLNDSIEYGDSMCLIDDINGDNVKDILVGASEASYGAYSSGSVYVYSGSDFSLVHRFDGVVEEGYFGSFVTQTEDLTGDGIPEIIISAEEEAYGAEYAGSVYIYSGSDFSIVHRFDGEIANGYFGKAVSAASDLNNDGVADIVIGCPEADYSGLSSGSVYIYSGSDFSLIHRIDASNNFEYFGSSVNAENDIDNDGIADLLVGAPQAEVNGDSVGSVYLYSGSDFFLIHRFDGTEDNSEFGTTVKICSDINNDNRADIIICDPHASNNLSGSGSVYLYSGSDFSLIHRFDGDYDGGYLGSSVAVTDDINSDGYSEIILSSPFSSPPNPSFENLNINGSVEIFSLKDFSKIKKYSGPTEYSIFGKMVFYSNDLDGDGYFDFLASAPFFSSETEEGRVYLVNIQNNELPEIAEDVSDELISGSTVSEIIDQSNEDIEDIESTVFGIAVTDFSDINGTWQYSIDSGVTWNNISELTISDSSALLLDNNDIIRFVPAANYYGSNKGSVFYKIWDMSSGSSGDINIDTTSESGYSFSNDKLNVSVSVTPVNDAPTLTAIPTPIPIPEDSGEQIVPIEGIGSGVTTGAGTEDQTLTVTAVSDNQGLIPNPTVVYTSPALTGSLAFTPAANNHGTANITVTVTDSGQDGISGNGDDLSVSDVFMVTINPVNDTPTLTAIADPAAINEDAGEQTVSLAGIGSGVLSGPGMESDILVVTAVSDNTGLIPNPTVTYTSPELTGSLAYTPAANNHGTANITVTVTDSGLDGISGNGDDLSVSDVFMVTVNPVNDVPVLTTTAEKFHQFDGAAANDNFGYSVSSAGDLNNDGYDDIIIGAVGTNLDTGSVFVYSGNPNDNNLLIKRFDGEAEADTYFGCSVSSAGDLNNDGYNDIIIGAYITNSFTGSVYVYSGNPNDNNLLIKRFNGEAEGVAFGYSVSNACDVNNDGYNDIIIGAVATNSYTGSVFVYSGNPEDNNILIKRFNGEAEGDCFGNSVSSAGDINKDGYADIIIGAPNTNTDAGSVYVYSLNPAHEAQTLIKRFNGEAEGDCFGNSVSSAGDVNKDGYADIIIGAPNTNTDAGSVYVYSGDPDDNNILIKKINGEKANDWFGTSVSSAGDVNKDGYADIIVGAYGTNSYTGSVYVYSLNPAHEAQPLIKRFDGTFAYAEFGASISSPGALNKDGYADIIIGAFGTNSYTGSVYVYSFKHLNVSITAIDEDIVYESNAGTLVSDILNNSISTATDIENNTLGIAITGVTDTNGIWQYSIDSGSSWSSISSALPATTSALLLAETDKVRFVPDLNHNGTDNGSINYRAWDKTSGSSGDTDADTTVGTAWSSFTATAVITVNPVNDAPTLTAIADPAAINEDAGEQTVSLAGMGSGVLSGPGMESDTLVVTAVSDNTGLIPNPVVTYTSPALTGSLAFTPVANNHGTANITVTVTDSGQDGISGNGDDLSVSDVFMVTINPVNDTPTLTAISDPAAINEDAGEQTVSLAGIGSGVLSGPGMEDDTLVVTAVSDNTGLIPNPVVTYTSPALTGSLAFTPVANNHGTANITVTVTDSGQDGISGNGDDLSVSDVFMVTINPVNDPPVLDNSKTLSFAPIYENADIKNSDDTVYNDSTDPSGMLVSAILNGSVSDIEQTVFGIAVISTVSGGGDWQYSISEIDGVRQWISFSKDINNSNTLFLDLNSQIRFLPTTDFVGTQSFTFKAWDKAADTSFGNITAPVYKDISLVSAEADSVLSSQSAVSAVEILDHSVKISIIPESAAENQGILKEQALISIPLIRNVDTRFMIRITGTGNYEGRISTPVFSTILKGTTHEAFDIEIINNEKIDGQCTLNFELFAEKWQSDSDSLALTDDEIKSISLSLPVEMNEKNTDINITEKGQIILSGIVLIDTEISLSSDTPRLEIPKSVVVKANSNKADFDIKTVDDNRFTGDLTYTLTGICNSWSSGSASLAIIDDEEQKMTLQTGSSFSENSGINSDAASVSIEGIINTDLTVLLSSSNSSKIIVPEQVIITAGTDRTFFSVQVLDNTIVNDTEAVTISAVESTSVYESVTSTIYVNDDDSDKKIILSGLDFIFENSGENKDFITIQVDPIQSSGLVVDLSSSNPESAAVIEQIIIPAQAAEYKVDVSAIDNKTLDSIRNVVITAQISGWAPCYHKFEVHDDEVKALTLTTKDSMLKTDGIINKGGKVSVPPGFSGDLIVNLASANKDIISVQDSVTITAGQTFEYFDITVINDENYIDIENVEISAFSTGWEKGISKSVVYNPPKAEIDPLIVKAGTDNQVFTIYINPDCKGNNSLDYRGIKIAFDKDYFTFNSEVGFDTGKLNLHVTDFFNRSLLNETDENNQAVVIDSQENSILIKLAEQAGISESPDLRLIKVSFSGAVNALAPADSEGNISSQPIVKLIDSANMVLIGDKEIPREISALSGDGDMNKSVLNNSIVYYVKADILPAISKVISEVFPLEFNLLKSTNGSEQASELSIYIKIPDDSENLDSASVSGTGFNQLILSFPENLNPSINSIDLFNDSPISSEPVKMNPDSDYVKRVNPDDNSIRIISFNKPLMTKESTNPLYLKILCTLLLPVKPAVYEISGFLSFDDASLSDDKSINTNLTAGNADDVFNNNDSNLFMVNTVSAPPVISGLSLSDYFEVPLESSMLNLTADNSEYTDVQANKSISIMNSVNISRKAKIKWSSMDTDSSFDTYFFWSANDYSVTQLLDKINNADISVNLINKESILNNRLSQVPEDFGYIWDISALINNELLFTEGSTNSVPLFLYALAIDDNEPVAPLDGTTGPAQILKADSLFIIIRPDETDAPPEYSFIDLGINGADISADDSVTFKYNLVDDKINPVKVSYYFADKIDIYRALPCMNNGLPIIDIITPDLSSAEINEKQTSWNTNETKSGSYYIMAKIEDNVHQNFNVWSKYKINIEHPANDNIAPNFKWVAPDINIESFETSGDMVLKYEVSDENMDKLKIFFAYSSEKFESGITEIATIPEIDTSVGKVAGQINFKINDLESGAYYIYTNIKEIDRNKPSLALWSKFPIIIDKGENIFDLVLSSPINDPDNSGKCACLINFRTSNVALGGLKYKLEGSVSFDEVYESSQDISHSIWLRNLAPGKKYLFKALANFQTAIGEKKEYLDNCGNLYTINIPSNMASSDKFNFIKGKVNTSTGGTVKVYVAKPVDLDISGQEEGYLISEPFVSTLDVKGEFLIDINKCIFYTSKTESILVEEPLDTYKARVEIILDDERQIYKDNLSLSGIETANSADVPLLLDIFWNNGLGIDINDEKSIESSITLVKGFNMISLMLKSTENINASDLFDIIGKNAIMIAMYDANEKKYRSYINLEDNIRIGEDFKILSDTSFFVKVTDETEFEFTGKKFKKSKIIKLLKGFNLVCIPFSSKYPASKKTGMTAESILKRIGKNGLGVYKYKDGNYITYLYLGEDENGNPQFMGNKGNFDILLGEGVFIYSSEDCSFWAE